MRNFDNRKMSNYIRLYSKPHSPLACVLCVVLISCMIFITSHSLGQNALYESSNNSRLSQWIIKQQNSKTGLFRSYDMPGDYTAWTYDQAIAIIALNAGGHTKTAKTCADKMLKLRDKKLKAWADGYHAGTGQVTARPVAVGPNAWMGIALLRLHVVTHEIKYLTAAEELADFMLKLQISQGKAAGAVSGGYDENGQLFSWTSTEHNVDFIAFMAGLYEVTQKEEYRRACLKTAEWLHREMWNLTEHCYYPGYSDNNTLEISQFHERLDSQTWSILALTAAENLCNIPDFKKYIHNGLPWIDQYLQKFSYQDHELSGFSKVTLAEQAMPSIWCEGTAGYILAARIVGHQTDSLGDLVQSLSYLQNDLGALPHSVGITFPEITKQFQSGDILIDHFESHPNCLLGNIELYGDGEPDWQAVKKTGFKEPYSWYYTPDCPGYLKENVHNGIQSFRLVNATDMCLTQNRGWSSLGIDLGPENGTTPFDASQYKAFSFWAKTLTDKEAQIKVEFRDANAKNYLPQISADITFPGIDKSWKKYSVKLDKLRHQVDLEKLVHIGLAFGKDVGNPAGTVIFVDDVAFTGYSGVLSQGKQTSMPAKFPQHWPYNNVGASAWLIFVEFNVNPFEVATFSGNTQRIQSDNSNNKKAEEGNEIEQPSYSDDFP